MSENKEANDHDDDNPLKWKNERHEKEVEKKCM